MANVLENALSNALLSMERAVDDELERLDNMEEDDYKKIRAKRMAEMKKKQEKMREWERLGHGKVNDISDEKDFFSDLKGSERVVVFFYRTANKFCDDLYAHLRVVAPYHKETKFVRIDAEKSPFLTERLKIWMLPTLVLVKDGQTEKSIVGLDEISGTGKFDSSILEQKLHIEGIIDEPVMEVKRPEEEEEEDSDDDL
uniref:Thioredoxin domain-containing protein n=1 Tax=Palpitomonas bilix TaxID=652834 RepID=A0A7S3G1M2_9EUKA|mmetsp:Transcript_18477/g.46479  ORF Transcript_18477/g.46479 Transcript_18477/m.46479 type:complete len:199 (+) Transcript_18477:316-912(+)